MLEKFPSSINIEEWMMKAKQEQQNTKSFVDSTYTVSLDKYNQAVQNYMQDTWTSIDKARIDMLEAYKDEWLKIEWIDMESAINQLSSRQKNQSIQPQKQMSTEKEPTMLWNIARWATNITRDAVSGTISGVVWAPWNILEFTQRALWWGADLVWLPPVVWELARFSADETEKLNKQIQDTMQEIASATFSDTETFNQNSSLTSDVFKFWWEIFSPLPKWPSVATKWGAIATKVWEKFTKIAEWVTKLQTKLSKLPTKTIEKIAEKTPDNIKNVLWGIQSSWAGRASGKIKKWTDFAASSLTKAAPDVVVWAAKTGWDIPTPTEFVIGWILQMPISAVRHFSSSGDITKLKSKAIDLYEQIMPSKQKKTVQDGTNSIKKWLQWAEEMASKLDEFGIVKSTEPWVLWAAENLKAYKKALGEKMNELKWDVEVDVSSYFGKIKALASKLNPKKWEQHKVSIDKEFAKASELAWASTSKRVIAQEVDDMNTFFQNGTMNINTIHQRISDLWAKIDALWKSGDVWEARLLWVIKKEYENMFEGAISKADDMAELRNLWGNAKKFEETINDVFKRTIWKKWGENSIGIWVDAVLLSNLLNDFSWEKAKSALWQKIIREAMLKEKSLWNKFSVFMDTVEKLWQASKTPEKVLEDIRKFREALTRWVEKTTMGAVWNIE
jgi:hypothetical protein